MSSSLCAFLFLFLLHSRKALVLATIPECPDNNCCPEVRKQLLEMMFVINEMNSKLNKQAKDLEDMKTNLNKVRVSTDVTSTQLNNLIQDLLDHDTSQDQLFSSENRLVQGIHDALLGPRDCSDIRTMGYTTSGVYRVYPGSVDKRFETDVYCDFKSSTESWLVFQRRTDGSENFDRVFSEYQLGFGNLTREFWLGNEILSLLTMNRRYKLRVELEDFTGEKRYAEYSTFSVKPATDKYRLTVGGYSGNAGDSLSYHSGMQFTTKDVDNDSWIGNCAVTYRGAWWHNACHYSNLNGLYLGGPHTSFADGIEWVTWRGYYYSYKTTEMKIAAY